MKENTYIEDDEITLKELILKIQEFYREVLKNWLLVILITLPIMGYMFYKAYKTPVTYPATLTFMVNEDEGGGLGGLGGLAASFGLGGGGGEYNLEKILSLLKSRNIIQQALFEKIELNGKNDFFANHLIDEYEYHKKWEKRKDEKIKNFKFSQDDFKTFSRTENKALKQLHRLVVGDSKSGTKGVMSSSVNEDTGIMSINVNSTDEQLSIDLTDTLFSKLEEFYVEKTIEKQRKTFDIAKAKTDSLLRELNSKQLQLLRLQDSQRGLMLKQFKAKELMLQGQLQALALGYGEALKNQEIADFSLKSKTPFIQTIDTPIAPLKPSKTLMTYVKNLIIGGFLGGFLAVGYILVRKIFRDAMSEKTA
ncbi:MAG TPA: hypothetical protein ENK52_04050 [Saprospiraceae bacterium]|nr:hypothetical protein [Saprospiraceae bacterium]